MKQHFERNWGGLRNPTPNKNCVDFVDIQLWANKSLDRRKSHWIVWFHLVEIEAIWATGQLTTKICNWDSLFFFEAFWVLFVFGCWLFGNVLASCFGHLHQPYFSSQRAVLCQLECTQKACEIFWDFNIRKWPLNLSQKMADKILSILVWFKSWSSAAWACLKPFDWFWG